jgi:putative hydrolase of the HAD superfamily
MLKNSKVIGFDADDTLWINEPYFQETESEFCNLMHSFADPSAVSEILYRTELQNLALYGYGVKGFVLSMIETSLRISENKMPQEITEKIIVLGKELLNLPIQLLEGTETVLQQLSPHYKLIVATKGDLLDQERKLKKSGLGKYFHHVEIMSDKTGKEYLSLLKHLDIKPEEFVMIGNSIKSDILPALKIGSYAIHIPFHTIWEHEKVDEEITHPHFIELESISQLTSLFNYEKID